MEMKCWVLLVNRGRGKLYKRAKFGAANGAVKGLIHEKFKFTIGDKVNPFTLDLGSPTAKNKTVPLFIVNDMTKTALGVELKEISDVDADTKLNLLTKASFWANMAKKIKMSVWETLILLFAGGGLFFLIQYVFRIVFLRQG